jgi:hypothetical protein
MIFFFCYWLKSYVIKPTTKEEFMNTRQTSTTTDTQNQKNEKKAFFSTQILEKKRPIKSLSLRPTRSVKKISSLKPLPLKRT